MACRKDIVAQIQQANFRVHQIKDSLPDKVISFIKNENDRLHSIKKNVTNMSPERVLQRGFSITLKNGKAVKSIEDIKAGDTLETLVADGTINSEVKSAKKENDNE